MSKGDGGTGTGDAARAAREARDGSASLEGPYRIATVAELTGVPEPTLRAWERRYGVPSPQRTTSGYRLYGPDEVNQVLEMRRLCDDEGMAAAEAAQAVLARKAAIASLAAGASGASRRGEGGAGAVRSEDDAYAAVVDAMLHAVTHFDDQSLDEQLRRLMFFGSAARIFERVMTPVLRTIGDRWHAGELSVAQEHFASQRLGGVLRDLVRLSPGVDASSCAVLGCFADEEHELGLLGVALRVSEWGTRPIFLGARTPPSAVRSAVQALEPRLVALSVSVTPPRARARELIEDYGAACGDVPWIVGGAAAADLADLVAKHGGIVAPDNTGALRALVRPLLGGRANAFQREQKRALR